MINATLGLYKNAYSGLSRKIWLLSAVMLINRIGTMVLAFMTLYCKHLGFTIEQGGLVVAIYGLGAVAGALLGGKLSDRFGFYFMQFGALFLGGILFIVLGQMTSYTAICVSAFILAMVNESFRPANATAIAHYSTVKNRTQSFSLVRLAINLGFGVGIAIGGVLASVNYHLLFWVDGCTSISASFILLILLPRVTLHQQKNTDLSLKINEKVIPAYRDKVFVTFLIFQLLFAICFFQLFTTIPLFFKENLHLNEFWIGVVMAVNGLIIAVFEMVIVFKLEGRRPYLLLISYGCIMMGVSFLMLNLPLASGLLIALLATLFITLAEMLSMPFMNSYYLSRSVQANRGQYAGMYTMVWSLAQVAGSSTGAVYADRFGFTNLWFLVTIICIISGIGYYWMHRRAAVR